jgi:hypothetical protein
MKIHAISVTVITVCSLAFLASCSSQNQTDMVDDPRDNTSPWAMCSGAEWGNQYPRFHPMISEAGARWVRTFPEWHTIQSAPGEWNWEKMDDIMADLKKNNLRTVGLWCYFSKFASADGGTRKGPIKDIQYWKDYVTGSVERYHGDIKYWEVWNEFNGSFYVGENKPEAYAELVVAAYDAAKAVDPSVKVGMSTASTDIGFLDLAIRAGAAGHFDYVIVHPYENLDAMKYGDEAGFLGLADTIREMLRQNGEDPDMPIWITEIGAQTTVQADTENDQHQAEMLVKSYILPLVQGFDRVYWFEIRGPTYGSNTDFGIIRADWTLRPSFHAFDTLTNQLGQNSEYLGWVNLGTNGHGFLFNGADGEVLVAWAIPEKSGEVRFENPVTVISMLGEALLLESGARLSFGDTPVYLKNLPAEMIQLARSNRDQPFPWGGDFSDAEELVYRDGFTSNDGGLVSVKLRKDHENRSVSTQEGGERVLKVIGKDKDNNSLYLRADTGYLPYGTTRIEVTVVAKRIPGGGEPQVSLTYETKAGYVDFKKGGDVWTVPAGDDWQEHTWTLDDACFANRWGWHLGLISLGADEFLVKEVRIRKVSQD